jgi:hypothetical protein
MTLRPEGPAGRGKVTFDPLLKPKSHDNISNRHTLLEFLFLPGVTIFPGMLL